MNVFRVARVPIIREGSTWKRNRVTVEAFPPLQYPGERHLPGFVVMDSEPVSDPMLTPFRAEQLGRALIEAARIARRKPR